MQNIVFPPFLTSGDKLKVIAPSGTLRSPELAALEEGLEILRQEDYQIELSGYYKAQEGYLAGDDNIRRQELREAWLNPEYKGIFCVRGGYGSARLLENWEWNPIPSPKWVIGFSDVTGLLWSLFKEGIGSIHAPVLTTISQESDWTRKRLFDLLRGKPLDSLQGKGWGGGKTTGLLLPANLTVATHLLATPICPKFDHIILALEDVQEAPYRIDRMLTQWRMMGIFKQVKGIALGRFSNCNAPQHIPSWTIDEVLGDRLKDVKIPIVSNLPFGHEGENAPLTVGAKVELDGDKGILSFCN